MDEKEFVQNMVMQNNVQQKIVEPYSAESRRLTRKMPLHACPVPSEHLVVGIGRDR